MTKGMGRSMDEKLCKELIRIATRIRKKYGTLSRYFEEHIL